MQHYSRVTESNKIIDLKDVRFVWPGHTRFSLSISEFSLEQGETSLLLGDSGSGKSTLLSLISGTIVPNSGIVNVGGMDIAKLPNGKRDRFRAEHVGMIFQQFNLLPFGTVLDNILLPLRFAPQRRVRAGGIRSEAVELCVALGLPRDIMSVQAAKLSVGQQQRVAVARALIGRPPIVIADEPTSALDVNSQLAFLDLLFEQVTAHGTSLLMVSHDARLGNRFDRVLQMAEITQIEERAL